MEHFMSLYERPFNDILSGEKTLEIRLNDEKRRKVSVGDHIIFSKLSSEGETLKVEVVGLHPYKSFKELYEAFPFSGFGCEGRTMEDLLEGTYKLWNKEREEKYGALGLRIKLIV